MKTISELREESNGQTRFLFHIAYYDGPKSGLMLIDGEKAYFSHEDDVYEKLPVSEKELERATSICKETNGTDIEDYIDYHYDIHSYFKVYRLTPEILSDIEYEHSLFEKYVGTHNNYYYDGSRGTYGKTTMSQDEWRKFYDRKDKRNSTPDVSKLECIGEFEL